MPLIVQIEAGLDPETAIASWRIQGLNPATGELETAPELGFLPPKRTSPEGQGGGWWPEPEERKDAVANFRDTQLERAVDALKGVMIYAEKTGPVKRASAN